MSAIAGQAELNELTLQLVYCVSIIEGGESIGGGACVLSTNNIIGLHGVQKLNLTSCSTIEVLI